MSQRRALTAWAALSPQTPRATLVPRMMGETMRVKRLVQRRGVWVVAVCVFAVLALTGCASGGGTSGSGDGKTGGEPAGQSASATVDQTAISEIPPGRSISEGGGGPTQYTFREEWRTALAEARKWRSGAYLISASGDMVNDEGVPNHWSLSFIDKADADAVLLVEVDPWGKITETREVTDDGVGSFVDTFTNRLPYDVIDSDKAVQIGKAALAARYDLAATKDPRIGLNFSVLDGSGPYWSYSLFHQPTAEYVSAQIDARTGEVTPPK